MAGKQASGKLIYNVEVNSAKAFSNISQLKGQVRAIHNEWRNQYNVLQASNQQYEATATKVKGLKEEYKAEKAVLAQSEITLKGVKNMTGDHTREINRAEAAVKRHQVQLKRLNSSLEESQRIQTLYSKQVRESTAAVKNQRENSKQNIAMLEAEGKEYDKQQAHIKGYQKNIDVLTEHAKNLRSAIINYGINSSLTTQELVNDKYFQKFNNELKATRTEIKNNENNLRDYKLGLKDLNDYSKQYEQTTKSLVARLKEESGAAIANKESYERLSEQRKMDIQQHKLQVEQMRRVADESGKDSKAYQEEVRKLNELDRAFHNHSVKLNEAGKGYENMSDKQARAYDKTAKRADSLDKFSTGAMNMAHRMTTGSIAVGTMFGYGMQQASQLEDSYVKTSNLMKTAGEDQQEVHHNVTQMQSDAKKYAIQYGESQQDIANGYQELTRRGYDSQQALSSNKSYLDASIASGDKYNDVIETGASAIEGFGKRSDNAKEMTKNTKEVLNQMAYAADLSASDFNSLGDSMRYVSSTSRHANQDVGTTSSAIGILSNAGQKGSTAGTGLRQVLDRFTSISTSGRSQQGKILEKLGLSKQDFQDQHGRLKNIADLFDIMNSHMQGFSDSDKADMFHGFFGTTGQESAKILSGNVDGLRDLNSQVSKAQDQNNGKGYIADLAEKNMQSTQAQFNRARESIKLASQTIAESLMPAAKWGAEHLANLGDNLRKMPGWGKMLIGGIAVVIPTIAALGYAIGGVTRGFQLFHRSINGSRRLYARLTGRHHRVQTRIEKEAEAYDLNTAAVKRNTRAKEVNDGTGGGSGGPSSGSGSSYGSSYDGYSSSGSSRKGRSRSSSNSKTSSSSSSTSREIGNVSRTEREASSTAKETGRLGKVLRPVGKVVSGLGKTAGAIAAVGSIVDVLSMLNGKNIGPKIAGGLGNMLPIVGPAVGSKMQQSAMDGTKDPVYRDKVNRVNKNLKPPEPEVDQQQNGSDINSSMNAQFAQSQVRSNARDNNNNSNSQTYNAQFSQDMLNDNKQTYRIMQNQLDSFNTDSQSKSKSNLDYLVKIGAISQAEMAKDLQKGDNKRQRNVDKAKKSINSLSAAEEKGGKQRGKAAEKAQEAITKATTRGSNNQKIVLGQLRNSTKKISDKQAGTLINNSYKSMKETTDNANEEYRKVVNKANRRYKKTTDALNEERYVSGTISQQKYDDQMKKAEDERKGVTGKARDQKNDTIGHAQEQHEKVKTEAENQSNDHLATLDTETGKAKSKWQTYSDNVREIFGSLKDFFGDFGHNISKLLSPDNNGSSIKGDYKPTDWQAQQMKKAGISSKDMGKYNNIITNESSWDPKNTNKETGAYGLGQANNSNKDDLLSGKYGKNPSTNINTQLKWMQDYITNRYGNVENALAFRQKHGWYANGGWSKEGEQSIFGEIPGQPEVAINPKRKSADNLIGEAIQARSQSDGSSQWAKLQSSMEKISSQAQLTDNSKVVQMLSRSLEFISQKTNSSKSSSSSNNDEYIKELKADNKRKDIKLNNVLDKMDNLISAIENKPTISDTQIYKANRRQTHTQQKQQNMLQGGF